MGIKKSKRKLKEEKKKSRRRLKFKGTGKNGSELSFVSRGSTFTLF
jgi:hypothetical protein